MGRPIGLQEAIASLAVGASGVLIFGLQPLLYGAYVTEHMISESTLGVVGAVEAGAIAIGSGAAIVMFRSVRPGILLVFATLAIVLGNIIDPQTGGLAVLLLARCVAGFGGGLAVGMSGAAIAKTHKVGRWMAVFQLIQVLTQFFVMESFALFAPAPTSLTVQYALGGVAFLFLAAFPFLPETLAMSDGEGDAAAGEPNRNGIYGLLSIGLFVGATVTIWAYAGLWMQARSVDENLVVSLLSWSLAGQVLGSFLSVVAGDGRHIWGRAVLQMLVLVILVCVWMIFPGSVPLVIGFGIVWQATIPLMVSALVEIDPERRAVPYAASAQIAGIAVVPPLIGIAFGNSNLDYLMAASVVIAGLSALLLMGLGIAVLRRPALPERTADPSQKLGKT